MAAKKKKTNLDMLKKIVQGRTEKGMGDLVLGRKQRGSSAKIAPDVYTKSALGSSVIDKATGQAVTGYPKKKKKNGKP